MAAGSSARHAVLFLLVNVAECDRQSECSVLKADKKKEKKKDKSM